MKKTRGKSNTAARGKKLSAMDILILGGVIVAIGVITVLIILIFNASGGEGELVDGMGTPLDESSSQVSDESYDKDAIVVDKKQFSGTVLGKTADAGQSYIDETLFIGDSNTVRMMSYGHTTLANDVAATSMGIQHVITKGIALFDGYKDPLTVPKAVEIIQPRRIIITYGTNNTIGWTPKTFAEEYDKAIKAILKAYPHTDIIINSVPPVDKIRENPSITMKTIDSFNAALAELAKKEGYKYLDSAEALKDETHGYAKTDYTIADGIHLSKKGTDALFEYIKTHSYETEDTRPKPLKKVPTRKETPPNIITGDPAFDRTQVTDKKAITISYASANNDMGYVDGEVSQKIAPTKQAKAVVAVPREGYAFAGWGCSVGRIDNEGEQTLVFNVPTTTEKTISVTASFVKASIYAYNSAGEVMASVALNVGDTYKPSIGFAPKSYQHSKDLAYATSNTAVATVSYDGVITASGAGDAVISIVALSGKLQTQILVTVAGGTPSTAGQP